MRRRMIWTLWWVLLPVIVSAGPTPTQHRLTVTFDYDFTTNHGCKKKDAGRCVAQFNIYEITDAAKPVKLFLIYAPRGAKKAVKGIKAVSYTHLTLPTKA